MFSDWGRSRQTLGSFCDFTPKNFEKNVSRIVHVIITNEVPVTILQAYIFLSRHIRKGVLIRRNIVSDLCDAAVGYQQFHKESRKRQKRIMFERNYSFFHHCVLPCH